MKLRRAEIIPQPGAFSSNVNRIARAEALPNEWSMYRLVFDVNEHVDQAKLLVMGAEYFAVYINGEFCTEYCIRSYIFHRAYEMYDVSDYIKEGKNVIALLACEKGNPNNRGIACELQLDNGGQITSICDGFKTAKYEAIVNPMTYQLGGHAPEIHDARKELEGWKEVNFCDVNWQPAEIVGAVDSAPYTDLVQSFQKAQTRDELEPVRVAYFENTEKYEGYDVCLQGPGNSFCCFMTTLHVAKDTTVYLAPTSGVSEASLDGVNISLKKEIALKAGTHTFSVLSYGGGCSMFELRTKGTLSFTAPSNTIDSTWVVFSAARPTIPYRIGWNDHIAPVSVPEQISAFMKAVDFSALSSETQEACQKAELGTCSLWHTIMNQKNVGAPEHFEDLTGQPIVIPARDTAVSLMFDYDIERIGLFTLELDAPKDTVLTYFMFEIITQSGIRYMTHYQGQYICKDGRQLFTSNTIRGHRYAVITIPACEKDITIYKANVIETRYNTEPAGAFTSNDAYFNNIYQISINTAKTCFMDSYVDCCGCEQNTWVGDAGITAEINMVNFGEEAFDARYLDTIGRSMDDGMRLYRGRNPRYVNRLQLPCSCFPTYPEAGIPIWSFMWVLQILSHYLYFGMSEDVERGLNDIDECFIRCRKQTNERGLLDIDEAWNLIEWADNDLMVCGEVTANNMMLSYCLMQTASVLRELGRNEKAEEYEAWGRSYKEAVNLYCWDESRHAYVDTVRDEFAYKRYVTYFEQTGRTPYSYEDYLNCGRISVQTNTFALLYDCATEERKPYCEALLLKSVESGTYRKGAPMNVVPKADAPIVSVGSPFFLYYTLKTLYKLGHHDIATNVIRRDWGAMCDDGLTTCVETFQDERGEWGRSAAHAWSASPAIFLMTEVLGIKPTKPGYAEFTVEPHPAGLTHASGAVPTPHGNIYVEWTYTDGKLDIQCQAPEQCKRIF